MRFLLLCLSIIPVLSFAVINGSAVTVSGTTLCNNGSIERTVAGTMTTTCGDGWSVGALPVVDPAILPLATWPASFTYAGAFRVPNVTGVGRTAFSHGMIGLSATPGNIYLTLHPTNHKGITELVIPTLNTSATIGDLTVATVAQDKLELFNPTGGNPDENNIIAGLYVHSGKLIYTASQSYDGDSNNTTFLGRVNTPTDFATTTVDGFYDVEGRFKAAGWISPVPTEWQATLGYEHVIGHANNWSIKSRASLGPSMYGIDLDNVLTAVDPVPTETLLSYSSIPGEQLQQQVNPVWTLTNDSGNNDIWTDNSNAGYGFIVPGTRTYAVFGQSAGHVSKIGYKIVQDTGDTCAGYCPNVRGDWSYYHWFYDLNDILDVKNGVKQSYEIVPYSYGPIDTLYELNRGSDVAEAGLKIRGGAFDPVAGRLYLSGGSLDPVSPYDSVPMIWAYDVGAP